MAMRKGQRLDNERADLEDFGLAHHPLLNLGKTKPVDPQQVRELQRLLERNGIRITLTGELDEQTTEAIKFFQREHVARDGFYLRESGTVDGPTLEALLYARQRFGIAFV